MKSLLASVRAGGGLDRVDHAVQLLEDEWRKHGDVPLERLWTEQKRLLESDADQSIVLLAELIKTDLQCRFARGQTPAVADYLVRFPELKTADSRVLSLIYEEFCLVEERGGTVDVGAFCERYPRWKESLVSQLQYHRLFSQAAGSRPKAPPFPEAGGSFEEFQLVSQLGKGGSSRVFLARDLSLGGKQVVLKVSLDRGREPQAQGALDHPHIVPVNSVVFGDSEMRGLSMPYRPGLPLDEVIRRVDPASRPRRAMALWDALVRVPETHSDPPSKTETSAHSHAQAPGPRGDGWEGFPVHGNYAQGVAWVGTVIAGALHYAHAQRTFHRDVKPANVLLTLQHGPQLLDFNLAESPHSASQAQAAMHGGTLPYMAPEQIEAFLNPELWGKVAAPADIYSLGLVLRELLTGQAPDLPAETLAPARALRVLLDRRPLLDVTLRRNNPEIPYALEGVVAKCLSVSPDGRYANAGALVEDLDAFLERKPLVHAVNPSRRERSVNWTIRNRMRVTLVASFLVLFASGMAVERCEATRRPSGPIESSPMLLAAMKSIDERHAVEAIAPLKQLSDWYPDSILPKVYLSFAYDACQQEPAAESCFQEVLGSPSATKELAAWRKNHPALRKQLEQFADRRDQRADNIVETEGLTEIHRQESKSAQYALGKRAIELAWDGQPLSEAMSFKLAQFENGMGENEKACKQADEAIAVLQSIPTEDFSAQQVKIQKSIFRWSWLRCRVATKLAEHHRKAGTKDALARALRYLLVAENDLRQCSRYLGAFEYDITPKDKHRIQGLLVAALLTRTETELDLGDVGKALAYLRDARNAMKRYRALCLLVENGEPTYLARVEERLIEVARRCEEARNAGGENSIHPLDQTAAAELSKSG